jgi:multidrug efflux pump subunit AcrA (membrane-fusion protein)
MRRALRLAAAVLTAAIAACTGTGKNAPTPQPVTTVRVQNQAFMDVDVFALYSGTRTRLGTVTANGTATFRIPATVVGPGRELQFLADPIGSVQQGVSFGIYVRPGEQVTLTIPSTMR